MFHDLYNCQQPLFCFQDLGGDQLAVSTNYLPIYINSYTCIMLDVFIGEYWKSGHIEMVLLMS